MDEALDALIQALGGYVSDILLLSNARPTAQEAARVLGSSPVDKESVRMFRELMEKCEEAKFAPQTRVDLQALIRQGRDLLRALKGQL